MPTGERQLLSRFQAVSAREALVMMTAALVLGIAAGILSVGLNWSVHALREFSQNLGAGWLAILCHPMCVCTGLFPDSSRLLANRVEGC